MHSLTLSRGCSNNKDEYEALIAGLETRSRATYQAPLIYGDSKLMVRHINGLYHIRMPNLMPHFKRARELVQLFGGIQIYRVRRGYNC